MDDDEGEDPLPRDFSVALELGGALTSDNVVGYYVTTTVGGAVAGCCVRRFREFRALKKSLDAGGAVAAAFPHRTLASPGGRALAARLDGLRAWTAAVAAARDALDGPARRRVADFLGLRPGRPAPETPDKGPRASLASELSTPGTDGSADARRDDDDDGADGAAAAARDAERARELEALRRRHGAEAAARAAAATAEARAVAALAASERALDGERAAHAAELAALRASLGEARRQASLAESGWSRSLARCSDAERELGLLRSLPPPPRAPPPRKAAAFSCFSSP
jgi:hypothetical protein